MKVCDRQTPFSNSSKIHSFSGTSRTCTHDKPSRVSVPCHLRYPNWVCHYAVIVEALHHQSVSLSWCGGSQVAFPWNGTISQSLHHKPIIRTASPLQSDYPWSVMGSGWISQHSLSSCPVCDRPWKLNWKWRFKSRHRGGEQEMFVSIASVCASVSCLVTTSNCPFLAD